MTYHDTSGEYHNDMREERIKALAEALRPFARANQIGALHIPGAGATMTLHYHPAARQTFTLDALENARKALKDWDDD